MHNSYLLKSLKINELLVLYYSTKFNQFVISVQR